MKTIDGGDDGGNLIKSGSDDEWPSFPLAGGLRGAGVDGPNKGNMPDGTLRNGTLPNGTALKGTGPSIHGDGGEVLAFVIAGASVVLLVVALWRCARENQGQKVHLADPLLATDKEGLEPEPPGRAPGRAPRPGMGKSSSSRLRLGTGNSFRLSVRRIPVSADPAAGGDDGGGAAVRRARAAADFDPNGRGVGSRSGVEAWSVQKGGAVVPSPSGGRGRFRRGDAYIVLSTAGEDGGGGGGGGTPPSQLRWHVHFWIGSRCPAMRGGVAAARAVELDDLLGGDPMQHRQVEGIETGRFLGLFPGGVSYLDGDADDGLEDEGRLYRMVREGEHARYFEVPLACSSLNEGDAFLLDAGTKVFTWYGASASGCERITSTALAQGLMDGRKGDIQYFMDVGGFERITKTALAQGLMDGRKGDVQSFVNVGDGNKEFFELLGGRGEIAPAEEVEAELELEEEKHMYVVSDAEGFIDVYEVEWSLNSLVSDAVFIIDCGEDLYVWVGKDSTTAEREQSMLISQSFLEELGRSETTRIHRIKEGQESKFQQFLIEFELLVEV